MLKVTNAAVTNPGHGCPAHNVDYVEVIKFKDRNDLVDWLERNPNTKYEVVEYSVLNVNKTVEYKFN